MSRTNFRLYRNRCFLSTDMKKNYFRIYHDNKFYSSFQVKNQRMSVHIHLSLMRQLQTMIVERKRKRTYIKCFLFEGHYIRDMSESKVVEQQRDLSFWNEKWRMNNIGFHRSTVNKYISAFLFIENISIRL